MVLPKKYKNGKDMSFKERVDAALAAAGSNWDEFQRRTGVKRAHLRGNKKSRAVSILHKYTTVSPTWILTGELAESELHHAPFAYSINRVLEKLEATGEVILAKNPEFSLKFLADTFELPEDSQLVRDVFDLLEANPDYVLSKDGIVRA